MALIKKGRFNLRSWQRAFLPVVFLVFIAAACKISYRFSGASISPDVRTFSVERFAYRATYMMVGLDQTLTDALIDMCRSQTNLRVVSEFGDVEFEGEITEVRTQPTTVSADAIAEMNRFTITVRVKFTNTVEPQFNFDQTFSGHADYRSELDLSAVQEDLSGQIIKNIVEDVFNRAFVNW
jgi:hypothetical protein